MHYNSFSILDAAYIYAYFVIVICNQLLTFNKGENKLNCSRSLRTLAVLRKSNNEFSKFNAGCPENNAIAMHVLIFYTASKWASRN